MKIKNILYPFVWLWKKISFSFTWLWKKLSIFLVWFWKNFLILLAWFLKNKYKIIIGIFIVSLFISPIFVIRHLFKIEYLNDNNWGEIIGGCLGYYGTMILGVVSILQTQISLKQNAETFIADKYSSIKILKDCSFQIINNNEIAYKNRYEYPVNQYYVNLDNSFEFRKEQKWLNLRLFYDSTNFPINRIKLKGIIGNYSDKYYVDTKVQTDLVENPKKKCGQIEIVFMFTEEELKQFNHLFNEGQLILGLEFEIISSFNVLMNEKIEVNFEGLDIEQGPIEFDEDEQDWHIGSTSYKYIKGEKLWKKKNQKKLK